MKRYIVNLTPEERAGLEQLCSRGKTSAVTIQRAQILLRADDGLTDETSCKSYKAPVPRSSGRANAA